MSQTMNASRQCSEMGTTIQPIHVNFAWWCVLHMCYSPERDIRPRVPRVVPSYCYNHGQKLLRHMKITNLFPWCKFCSPPPPPQVKCSFPFPLFQCLKQLNIHKAFCNIIWRGKRLIQMKKSFSFKYQILLLFQKR